MGSDDVEERIFERIGAAIAAVLHDSAEIRFPWPGSVAIRAEDRADFGRAIAGELIKAGFTIGDSESGLQIRRAIDDVAAPETAE